MPLPTNSQTNQNRRNRAAQKSQVLGTSTPYKDELEDKNAADEKKKQQVKRRIDREDVERSKPKKKVTRDQKAKKMKNDEQQWFCAICNECRVENMVMCLQCNQWVHDMCAGGDLRNYVCGSCAP